MTITLNDARRYAFAKGATESDIEAETKLQMRQVGTVPFNNMIRALGLHSWNNSKAEWVRLAAALTARKLTRKGGRK